MLPVDFIEQLKAVFPRRSGDQGWGKVRMLIPRRLSEGYTWETIYKGAESYSIHCQKKGMVGTEFVKQAQTFFGPAAYFEEWAEMDTRSPAQIAAELRFASAKIKAEKLGFRAPYPGEPHEAYESCLRDLERSQQGLGSPKFQVVK